MLKRSLSTREAELEHEGTQVRAQAELEHEGTLVAQVTGPFLVSSFEAQRAAGSPNENRDWALTVPSGGVGVVKRNESGATLTT